MAVRPWSPGRRSSSARPWSARRWWTAQRSSGRPSSAGVRRSGRRRGGRGRRNGRRGNRRGRRHGRRGRVGWLGARAVHHQRDPRVGDGGRLIGRRRCGRLGGGASGQHEVVAGAGDLVGGAGDRRLQRRDQRRVVGRPASGELDLAHGPAGADGQRRSPPGHRPCRRTRSSGRPGAPSRPGPRTARRRRSRDGGSTRRRGSRSSTPPCTRATSSPVRRSSCRAPRSPPGSRAPDCGRGSAATALAAAAPGSIGSA